MLKRFIPLEIADNIRTVFNLPSSYIGGDITLFINGQLINSKDDNNNPFGYSLNEEEKYFEFFIPPEDDDVIYIIYDDDGSNPRGLSEGMALGAGVIKLKPGYSLISYVGAIFAMWDKTSHRVIYPDNILANVINLIIWQIEDRYNQDASNIIREIQTYNDDLGQYRTWTPSTGKGWTYNGEHVTNSSLYRVAEGEDYGDPNNNNYVYYNPNAFILSRTYLDNNDIVISLDEDNPIDDLPTGLRSGIHIYVKPEANLSITNGLLEIWF